MTSAFPRLPTILKSYSGNVIDIPADIPLRDEPVTSSEQMSTLKDVIQKVDAMKAANEKSRMERINSILDDEINLIQIKDQCRQDFRSGLVNILPPSASQSVTKDVTKKSDRLFEILKMRQPGTALSHFSIWQDTLNLLDDQKFADDFEADRANHLFRVRQIPIHLPIERPTISQIISSPKVSPSTLTLAAPIDKSMTQTPKMKKGRGRRVQLGLFRWNVFSPKTIIFQYENLFILWIKLTFPKWCCLCCNIPVLFHFWYSFFEINHHSHIFSHYWFLSKLAQKYFRWFQWNTQKIDYRHCQHPLLQFDSYKSATARSQQINW